MAKKLSGQHRRVALYAQVSTLDKGKVPETQLHALREYADRHGFIIAGEFVDYSAGVSEERRQYRLMLEAVRKRKIDVVLVWRYDRFARFT